MLQQSHPTSDERVILGAGASRLAALLALAGLAALAIGGFLGWSRHDQFSYFLHSYLVSYVYILSIALGGLFFVASQHASRAGWSVTVRRLAEILAGTLPWLTVLFLPILLPTLLGNASLYPWADASAVSRDPQLQHKAAYLNLPFFGIRAVFYFAVWGLFARYFLLRSREQDRTGDFGLTLRMERVSPVALILFALTITFASFDWLMSLEPHWFSTIYGVLYFSGSVVGGLAAMVVMAVVLQGTGRLSNSITVEHYHDLGKLLLSFVIFWAYIAFSQYLLIWYANLPEETLWYQVRASGSWSKVAVILLVAHLFIPFLGLLSRYAKRRKFVLAFWSVWLLMVHWLDMYWLVMPTYSPHGARPALLDAFCLAGLAAIYVATVLWVAGEQALSPQRDPRRAESLAFENF
jgi:hypothetical protein